MGDGRRRRRGVKQWTDCRGFLPRRLIMTPFLRLVNMLFNANVVPATLSTNMHIPSQDAVI